MMATGVCVASTTESSDAALGFDTVNVYYQEYNQDNQLVWSCASVEKFNIFEAIEAVLPSSYAITADDSWTKTTAGSGTFPSDTYGTISAITFNNSSYPNFAVKVCNSGDAGWTDATDYPLGWIRPFTDYGNYVLMPQNAPNDSVGSAYANVAICLTSSDVPSSAVLATKPLKALTNPAGLSAFLYTFDLKDLTNSITFSRTMYGKQFVGGQYVLSEITDTALRAGVTIYGYGSDAYLALLDATGGTGTGELIGQREAWIDYYTYMTQYSWMDKLFGYGTQYGGPDDEWSYRYWATYQKMNGVDNYAMFNLGYHSMIDGFYSFDFTPDGPYYYCTGNYFVLHYTES